MSFFFKFWGSRKFTIHCGLVFEFMFQSATLSASFHARVWPGKHRLGSPGQSVTGGRPAVFLQKTKTQLEYRDKCRMADSFYEETQQTTDVPPDPDPEHDAYKGT